SNSGKSTDSTKHDSGSTDEMSNTNPDGAADTKISASMTETTGSGPAMELSYHWTQGTVYRYKFHDDSVVHISANGMNMDTKASVETVYSMKVLSVDADGKAMVELTVEDMNLIQDGKSTSFIKSLPAEAKKATAEVDRKGHARFLRTVIVYVKD